MEPLALVAVALVLVGLAGIVVPVLPGVPLVFAGLVVAAASDGFERVGWITVAWLGALTLVSLLLDVLTSGAVVRRGGGSRSSAIGALLGALAGLPFGIPGLVLGPLIGAGCGEYLAVRDLARAGRAGLWAAAGLVAAVAARFAIAALLLTSFAAAWWL